MKTLVFMLSMLCATGALGQTASVLSSEPQHIQLPSHPQHASQQPLAAEQNILGDTAPTIAHGVRPMWELVPATDEISLGEAARVQRRQHANDSKAPVVWHN
jgi:hypothetical protein